MMNMSVRSEKYRAIADDCVAASERATEPDGRSHWLIMAQAWVRLAQQVEKLEQTEAEVANSEEPQAG